VRVRRLVPIAVILLLTLVAVVIVWPSEPDRYLPTGVPWPEGKGVSIGNFDRLEMRLGLDLQGGTRLLLKGEFAEGAEGNIDDAVEGTIRVLRKRVDAIGVAEAEITRQGESNIAVQLPGVTPEEARRLLGRTALLRFCEPATDLAPEVGACDDAGQFQQATGTIGGRRVSLTGRFLKSNAFVSADALGNPAVSFELQGDGPELFRQITARLIQRPLAIYLDDEQLSAPIVQSVISDRGQITGLTLDRARELVVQLNSGALPLQLTVLQEQNVDATLGADSVTRSVLAGEVGLLLVILFMVLYYRLPGVIAGAALLTYTALTLAVFKLIPITLTLAGIGGFVLSVGMAVDANILIFERMKEELRSGRSYGAAIEAGFARAWPSIRDSNVTTLITCVILWVLGGGISLPFLGTFDAPLVQGFALTLAIGVLVSMFSAITVTRTFMRSLVGTRISRRHDWMVPDLRPAAAAGEGSQP